MVPLVLGTAQGRTNLVTFRNHTVPLIEWPPHEWNPAVELKRDHVRLLAGGRLSRGCSSGNSRTANEPAPVS
jgi:hypothetical protein